MSESLRAQLGRLFMVGYEGDPAPVREALAAGRIGGVILFSRNVESAAQVQQLNQSFQRAAARRIPIGIDQEGGRVARLDRAGLGAGPSARLIALEGDVSAAYRWGAATGMVLRELGFNLNFAPVMDVDTNPDNPIIGDRAYGADPDTVTRFSAQAIDGLFSSGIVACGKHFPGHGDTELDSHLALPAVLHGVERLEQIELAPYKALSGRLRAVMTAHVVYPSWDADRPATMSSAILQKILRQAIGFDGVIISDDMEMAAVAERYDPVERVVLALEAGVDLVLVCKTRALWESAFDGVLKEAENAPALEKRIRAAARRVDGLLPDFS